MNSVRIPERFFSPGSALGATISRTGSPNGLVPTALRMPKRARPAARGPSWRYRIDPAASSAKGAARNLVW